MKHTNAYYEFPSQLFTAHDATTPLDYAREAYDRTECGVWTAFILRDGSSIPSADLESHQNTAAYASREFIGVRHGSIVGGSDADFTADDLLFPFSDEDLAEAWEYLENCVSNAD